MSPLLEQMIDRVRLLPTQSQEAIAALILEELADEQRWEEAFARSPETLTALAAKAVKQVQAGECRTAGFDEI